MLDRLWIFTVDAGTNNRPTTAFPARNAKYHIEDYAPGGSRMTPAEGAFRLGVPNLQFIRINNKPPLPDDEPGRKKTSFEQYGISFQPLNRVVWSMDIEGLLAGKSSVGGGTNPPCASWRSSFPT